MKDKLIDILLIVAFFYILLYGGHHALKLARYFSWI